MSRPLTFVLKATPEYEVDMSPLLPEKLAELSLADIKKIKLNSGNKKIPVTDLFKITGKAGDTVVIENSHKKLTAIGKEMNTGRIEIQGKVGDCLGQKMKGGEISLKGSAANWVGTNMRGGRINISGNAGDFVGAGKAGEMQGMAGGLIVINGHAGDRVGDRMRRGTIVVGKDCGDYCGSRMIAGTVAVLGQAGRYSGYAMKRGTIILTSEPDHLAATFQSCGDLELAYLRLLFKQFAQMGQPLSKFKNYSPVAHRFAGDAANQGLGEILILQ